MTRKTAKYIGLLALAIITFYWKTLLTNQFTLIAGWEGVSQSYAWMHFWLNSVWHGHIPLWDPYAFGGRPFAGEMQTAAYYPFRLLYALAPMNNNSMLSPRLYDEDWAFTHFLSALFMFGMLREFGRSRLASLMGSFGFALGGIMVRMGWPHYVESGIWLPAVLLFLHRALRAQTRSRALLEASLCGVSMGMSLLTGGVQFSIMQGIVIVTSLIWYRIAADRQSTSGWTWGGERLAALVPAERSHWLPVVAIGAVACIVAGCVGSAQLLPAMEYSHYAQRSITGGWISMAEKIPLDRMDRGMWPESISSVFFPMGFDGRIAGGEGWPIYFGVLPMFLAILAMWKCRANLWVRYMMGLALVTFLYTMGEFSPVYGLLYAIVPYLWVAREPSRFLYLVTFALAMLSAFGLDALLDASGERAVWAPARPYLKWIAIACGVALFLPSTFPQINLNLWSCVSLLLILASCAWLMHLSMYRATTGVRLGLVLFVLLDLGMFNWGEFTLAAAVKAGDTLQQMITLRKPAEFIKSRGGMNRVRVNTNPEPNIGDVYSVYSLWGGGATILTDYLRLLPHEDLLNVRYRIKPASTPDPGAVYDDHVWKIYEDKNAFSRAWMVHQTDLATSRDMAFDHLDQGNLDLHNVAVIEKALPRPLEAAAAADAVRIKSFDSDSIVISVNAASSGMVVISEPDYPGWRAKVNGESAEIHRVDGAIRGVVVPRGVSVVEMDYVPVRTYAGLILTFLTLSGVFVAWFRMRPRQTAR